MGRKIGNTLFSANYEVRYANPLDARQVVDAYADLTQLATWDKGDGNAYLYKGFIVSVVNDTEENNGLYFLVDAVNYEQEESWIKLGGVSDGVTKEYVDGSLNTRDLEIYRRQILLKPDTIIDDASTQIVYNDNPNYIVSPIEGRDEGEKFIYYSPNGTKYLTYDPSTNILESWHKVAQPNGWVRFDWLGTDSSTWQLDITNDGVILDSSGTSNLIIRDSDGSLGTLIVGGLVIGDVTGYLRAQDGSVYVSDYAGLNFEGEIIGDNFADEFHIEHNLWSKRHLVAIYDTDGNAIYPDIKIDVSTDIITFSNAVKMGTDYQVIIMGF